MKDSKSGGIVTGSEANGHSHNGADPFSAPSGAWAAGTGVQDDELPVQTPTAVSGAFYAHLTDTDPNTAVGEALDGDALRAFNIFNSARRKIGVTPYDLDTPLCEIPALPIAVAQHAGQEPSRTEIALWCSESMEDDPDVLMADFEVSKAKYIARRNTERDAEKAAARQLGGTGVLPAQRFTLETIEAIKGIGADVACRARALVLKENRRAWSIPKPNYLPGRTDLITAAELCVLGVDSTAIKALVPATDDEEIEAAERLVRARKHYEKFGSAEVINFVGGLVSPSQMCRKEPPRRLLSHWLYRGQLSELIAKPGGGKTFVALGWGLALASGTTHKTLGVPGGRVKVLYVAAEAPESVYLRVLGWCVHHGVDPTALDDWFTVFPEPVQLSDPEHMRQVRKFVQRNGIELAVFDTRAMVTMGTDENSSGEQGVAIAAVKALNADGAATLVVHHTPKDGKVGDGGRGSGAWFGAAYTSMYLKEDDKLGPVLVCDKSKDGTSKCKHPLTYATVTVPEAVMPNARDEERGTLALTHIDPFSDAATKTAELSAKELNTLLVLALKAPYKGMDGKSVFALAATEENPSGFDVGSRGLVYGSLGILCGEKSLGAPKYARVVSEKPSKHYRVTDEGWSLLVERELVTEEFADTHRHSAEDVGTPHYEAAAENMATAMEQLIGSGDIIPGRTQTMTQRKKLVESHMQGDGQEFSEAAWSSLYPRWVEDGWLDKVETAARAKAAQSKTTGENSTAD